MKIYRKLENVASSKAVLSVLSTTAESAAKPIHCSTKRRASGRHQHLRSGGGSLQLGAGCCQQVGDAFSPPVGLWGCSILRTWDFSKSGSSSTAHSPKWPLTSTKPQHTRQSGPWVAQSSSFSTAHLPKWFRFDFFWHSFKGGEFRSKICFLGGPGGFWKWVFWFLLVLIWFNMWCLISLWFGCDWFHNVMFVCWCPFVTDLFVSVFSAQSCRIQPWLRMWIIELLKVQRDMKRLQNQRQSLKQRFWMFPWSKAESAVFVFF